MFFFGCAIIVVIIGFPIYYIYLSYEARVVNTLHNTPEKKISQVTEGEIVRIRGKIKYLDKPLIAPLSGRKCVYYHATVEERSNHRHSNHTTDFIWSPNLDEEFAESVVIKNGKDYALIDTAIVHSYLVMDKEWISDSNKNASALQEKFLERHKEKSTNYLGFNRELRFKEGVLEENEIISVVGKASWKRKKEINFEIPVQKILVITAYNNNPVYLSDEPFAAGTD